jgi:hypothetical protein
MSLWPSRLWGVDSRFLGGSSNQYNCHPAESLEADRLGQEDLEQGNPLVLPFPSSCDTDTQPLRLYLHNLKDSPNTASRYESSLTVSILMSSSLTNRSRISLAKRSYLSRLVRRLYVVPAKIELVVSLPAMISVVALVAISSLERPFSSLCCKTRSNKSCRSGRSTIPSIRSLTICSPRSMLYLKSRTLCRGTKRLNNGAAHG